MCMFFSVCLSVCPLAQLENHQFFGTCSLWPWLGPPLTALRCDVLSFFWMTSCFHTIWPESSKTLCLEEIRQVTVPVGRQTTKMFGRVHHNVAQKANFSLYDSLDIV